jgi:cap1 methyltransferase
MPTTRYQMIRSKANLYERVKKGPFMCRAGMKMANLDAILNFELTQPKRKDDSSALGQNELFYFSDVCAGPGGFTE